MAPAAPSRADRAMATLPAELGARAPELLRGVASASTGPEQLKQLKRAVAALETMDGLSEAEQSEAAVWLADLCLVARPYGLNTQLVAAVEVLKTSPLDLGYRALTARLASRLHSELLQAHSLFSRGTAQAAAPAGCLREGPMPGWLELAFDIPPAAEILSTSVSLLLELITRSLSDAADAMPGASAGITTVTNFPPAACACVSELSRLVILLTRHARNALKAAAAEVLMEVATDAKAAATGSTRVGVKAGDEVGRALLDFWAACENLLLRSGLPADVALAIEHSRCACIELIEPRVRAAAAFSRLLSITSSNEQGTSGLTLRGVVQAASTLTLLESVECAPSPLLSRLTLESSSKHRSSVNVDGGGDITACQAQVGSTAGTREPTRGGDAGAIAETSLLFGVICPLTLVQCSAREPTRKLFGFRGMEAVLAHIEAAMGMRGAASGKRKAAAPKPAEHNTCAVAYATPSTAVLRAADTISLSTFLESALTLVWEHWDLSFSALTGMLPALFQRVLVLHAMCTSSSGAYPGRSASADTAIACESNGNYSVSPAYPHESPAWLDSTLTQCRMLDWSRKAKYSALIAILRLLPAGALTLIDTWPSLIPELLASLATPDCLSQANELVAELAASLREAVPRLTPREHTSAARDLSCSAKDPGIASCKAIWSKALLIPMIRSLSRAADVSHGDRILRAVLPPALASEPRCLEWTLALSLEAEKSRCGDANTEGLRETYDAAPAHSNSNASGPAIGISESMGGDRAATPMALSHRASVGVLISVLRIARGLGLVSATQVLELDRKISLGDFRSSSIEIGSRQSDQKGDDGSGSHSTAPSDPPCTPWERGTWPVGGSMLASSLASADESLALEAFELICSSRQMTEPPTISDLRLLRIFFELRLKGASADARRLIVDRLRRFLHRCKASTFASAQVKRDLARLDQVSALPVTSKDIELPRVVPERHAEAYAQQLIHTAGLGASADGTYCGQTTDTSSSPAAHSTTLPVGDFRDTHQPRQDVKAKGSERLALAAERRQIALHVAEWLRW